MVNVQNKQLDSFHVKQQMEQAAKDIEAGRILQSMYIEKQTQALRAAMLKPLIQARDLLTNQPLEPEEVDAHDRWGGLSRWRWRATAWRRGAAGSTRSSRTTAVQPDGAGWQVACCVRDTLLKLYVTEAESNA